MTKEQQEAMKKAEWLKFCLEIGWDKKDLDDLSAIWDKFKDPNYKPERTFSIQDMLNAIEYFSGTMIKGRRMGAGEYMKEKFNIDINKYNNG